MVKLGGKRETSQVGKKHVNGNQGGNKKIGGK